MIPHGDGPSSYHLPEMTWDTPRITFLMYACVSKYNTVLLRVIRLFAFEGVVGGAYRILRRLPSGGP